MDTNIWSLALRRSGTQTSDVEKKLTGLLRGLIEDDHARLIGPIRQELLSGIREQAQYERIRRYLRAFPDEAVVTDDYEQAARWNNQCRSRGITGSPTDFLICAVALNRNWEVFTTDADFPAYAEAIPLQLYSITK